MRIFNTRYNGWHSSSMSRRWSRVSSIPGLSTLRCRLYRQYRRTKEVTPTTDGEICSQIRRRALPRVDFVDIGDTDALVSRDISWSRRRDVKPCRSRERSISRPRKKKYDLSLFRHLPVSGIGIFLISTRRGPSFVAASIRRKRSHTKFRTRRTDSTEICAVLSEVFNCQSKCTESR